MKSSFWPGLLAAALLILLPTSVLAVPSYARQAGVDCIACHIGGFGPYYTPYGIRFKIRGYTLTDGKDGKIPLAAMANASWTRIAKSQNPPPEHFSGNDNGTLQEASVFLAGRLADHIGAFVQSTYSGVDRKLALDNVDVRYARALDLAGKDTVLGLSMNNNPTVQDPFNTLPAFRFPFISSELVPEFPTPIVQNLGQSVIGVNGYAFWDNSVYAEIGAYNSLSKTAQNMINAEDPGKFRGAAPYWRLAYFKDRGQDNFLVGLFGFDVHLQPDRGVLGTADKYRDIGVDAAYQYLGDREHIFTAATSYLRERQKLDFTFNHQGADNQKNSLDQFRISGSYYYRQTWGLTGSWFETRGSTDATLNASSLNGRPNTSGYIVQADWTPLGKASSWGAPWANVRVGVQYTGYNRFNGGAHYLDDAGNDRRAKDNNTWFVFVWTAI